MFIVVTHQDLNQKCGQILELARVDVVVLPHDLLHKELRELLTTVGDLKIDFSFELGELNV